MNTGIILRWTFPTTIFWDDGHALQLLQNTTDVSDSVTCTRDAAFGDLARAQHIGSWITYLGICPSIILCIAYLLAYEWAMSDTASELDDVEGGGGGGSDTGPSTSPVGDNDAVVVGKSAAAAAKEKPAPGGGKRRPSITAVAKEKDALSGLEGRLRRICIATAQQFLPKPWVFRTTVQLGVLGVGFSILFQALVIDLWICFILVGCVCVG